MENTSSNLNPDIITDQYTGAADEHEFRTGINDTSFRGFVPREGESLDFQRGQSARNVRREMTPLQRAYWQIQGDAIFEEPSVD